MSVASPAGGEAGFAALRAAEFGRLDATGSVYVDHTGSALYPASLVARHAERLASGVFGNPHSAHEPSQASSRIVEAARAAVLGFVDASDAEYTVVFTQNASTAIRLVAEAFPFQRGSRLLLSADNHNSVNGIREYARAAGARVRHLPLDDALRLRGAAEALDRDRPAAPSLFAFPAQSNFSGVRHPLSLVARARHAGYRVLLDAAAYAPTSPLSLAELHPDFCCLSLYKLTGYPTGVGALIVRRAALAALHRPWFAGGTVDWVSVQTVRHRLKRGAEGWEDGTPSFLDLAAVPDALGWLASLGMHAVQAHAERLTSQFISGLARLRTRRGAPRIALYGPAELAERGATVAFNVLDDGGRVIPYEQVEQAAAAEGIALRGGCFCNPGAAEQAFGIDAHEAARCLRRLARRPFSIPEMRDCLGGRPVGALRASFGIPNTPADVARVLAVLDRCATELSSGTEPPSGVALRAG